MVSHVRSIRQLQNHNPNSLSTSINTPYLITVGCIETTIRRLILCLNAPYLQMLYLHRRFTNHKAFVESSFDTHKSCMAIKNKGRLNPTHKDNNVYNVKDICEGVVLTSNHVAPTIVQNAQVRAKCTMLPTCRSSVSYTHLTLPTICSV